MSDWWESLLRRAERRGTLPPNGWGRQGTQVATNDRAAMRDPLLRKLRNLAMLKTKITTGMSNDLIAQQFGVSRKTLERGMNSVKNKDLIAKFEDELLEQLVPEAVKAVKDACANGNAQVALEVLKGAGILKKPRDMNRIAEGGDGDSLEVYLKLKRQAHQAAAPTGAQEGGGQEDGRPPQPSAQEGPQGLLPAHGDVDLETIERIVDDGPLDVVEGELLSTDSQSVDEDE